MVLQCCKKLETSFTDTWIDEILNDSPHTHTLNMCELRELDKRGWTKHCIPSEVG